MSEPEPKTRDSQKPEDTYFRKWRPCPKCGKLVEFNYPGVIREHKCVPVWFVVGSIATGGIAILDILAALLLGEAILAITAACVVVWVWIANYAARQDWSSQELAKYTTQELSEMNERAEYVRKRWMQLLASFGGSEE